MIKNYYYLLKVYAISTLFTFFLVNSITLSPLLGSNNRFYETSSKKVAKFELEDNFLLVSDSSSGLEEAEKLWMSINFMEMQKEITSTLGLSLMDATVFWEYLRPAIRQDQFSFLNGGYQSVTAATLAQYVNGLKQSYINQYSSFLTNKASFIQQLALQSANNKVQQVNGPCVNMGFETGDTTGWTTYDAAACTNPTPCPVAPATTLVPGPDPRITIKTAGFDPYVPTLSMVPPGATYSLMLEDYLNGANASEISQTFLVTATNNLLTYKYAAVLEDPGHPLAESPYFKVRLTAQDGTDISCGDYTAVAYPPIVNFDSIPKDKNVYKAQDPVKTNTNSIDVYYRNWTTVSIPLNKYIGQNLTITFMASDCTPGGHRGYAYIWAECSSIVTFDTSYICLGETLSYTAPTGFSGYKWIGPGTGATGIVGANNTQTAKVNKAGVYSLILTPYADHPCPDTLNFTVLEHCLPKADTALCETVKGSGKVTGVNLINYNTKITAVNPAGTVQAWYSALPISAATKIAAPTNITVSNGSKYYAVITYPYIGGDTGVLTFTVNPLPSVVFPAIDTMCVSAATYQITGVTPTGGAFSGTNVSASGAFSPSAAGKYTIKYVYTTASGCKDSATQTIVVNPPPTATSTNQTICSTVTSINLSGTVTNAKSELWTGGTTASFSSTTVLAPTYAPTATELSSSAIKLNFIAEPLAGCKADTAKVTITVVQLPKVTVTNTTICATTPSIVIAGATASNDASIKWTATSGSFSNASSLTSMYTPAITSDTIHLVLTANPNAPCKAVSDTMVLTVIPAPKVTVTNTTICATTSSIVIAGATASNNASVKWTATSGTFSNAASLTSTYTPTITSDTVHLILTANPNSPCKAVTDTMVLKVAPAPKVTVTNTSICATTPSIVIAGATASNDASVKWTATSGSFSNASSLTSTYTPFITSDTVHLVLTANPNSPCKAVTDTMVLTVIPTPKVNVFDTAICASTHSISIAKATVSNDASVKWTATSGSFSDAGSLTSTYTPTITSDTVHLVLTANPNSPCKAVSATMVVKVVPSPILTATDTTICFTTPYITTNATASNDSTVKWKASSGSFGNANSLITTYTPSITSDTVHLILTANPYFPCKAVTDTMVVKVVPAPKLTVSDTSICATTSSIIIARATASNDTSVKWTSTSGSFSDASSLTSTYAPTIKSDTVHLILTANPHSPCKAVTDTMVVKVVPAPKLTVSDTSICATTSSIVIDRATVSNDSTVKWKASSGSFSDVSSLTSTYTPTITSDTVNLILTANPHSPCKAVTDTVVVTVIPAPKVSVSDTSICATTSSIIIARATASNDTSVLWWASSGSFSNTSSLTSTYTPSITSDTVNLILTANPHSPCKAVTDTMVVKVVPAPKLTVSDTSICATTSSIVIARATVSNDSTVKWTATSGSFSDASSLTSTYTPTITSDTVNLILTANPHSPCKAVTDTMVVKVVPAPKLTVSDTSICATTSSIVIANASASDTTSVLWWASSGSFGNAGSLTSTYTPAIKSGKAHLILTANPNAPCKAVTDTMSVRVIPPPVVNAGPDQVVCLTSALVTLAGDTSNVSSFLWSPVNMLSGGSFTSTTSLNTQYTPSQTDIVNGQAVLILTGMGIAPCASASDSVNVINIPLPIVQVNDTTVCSGQIAVLKAHVLNKAFFQKYNLTYNWSWQRGATAVAAQDSVLSTQTAGIYQITANASGCRGADSGAVTINPLPVVNLPALVKFCPDTLSEYVLNAGTGPSYKYFWIPTNDTVSQISVNAQGTYTVTIANKYNCTASSQTVVQEVCPPRLYISSAFSPNNDGSNDIYDVYSAHVGSFQMLIFNRWGEIIYESSDKTKFWNGIYRGEPMPIGVYPWVITYEGDTEEYKGPYNMKGSVTVVR